MAGARHFYAAGTYPGDVKEDVKFEITVAHGNGDSGRVDELLDELNDANNGTWTPDHA
ncbi:hypothetical protein ACFU7X_41030 [Streptomyces chartreusis]|uniref:hypothetical protein n=1 Tax=Streptomyces chartreusis TaxID=1969 RepID=UPI003689170C